VAITAVRVAPEHQAALPARVLLALAVVAEVPVVVVQAARAVLVAAEPVLLAQWLQVVPPTLAVVGVDPAPRLEHLAVLVAPAS